MGFDSVGNRGVRKLLLRRWECLRETKKSKFKFGKDLSSPSSYTQPFYELPSSAGVNSLGS